MFTQMFCFMENLGIFRSANKSGKVVHDAVVKQMDSRYYSPENLGKFYIKGKDSLKSYFYKFFNYNLKKSPFKSKLFLKDFDIFPHNIVQVEIFR